MVLILFVQVLKGHENVLNLSLKKPAETLFNKAQSE